MGFKGHLPDILIYIYSVISASEPVFGLLLAKGVPSFETCLFMLFAPFSTGLSKRALYPFKVFVCVCEKEESISVLD